MIISEDFLKIVYFAAFFEYMCILIKFSFEKFQTYVFF